MIWLGRYNTVYWNHSNQTICSTFTANKYILFEAHAVVTMETSSVFLRSYGDFQKDCFLKDGLEKCDVSAG